MVSKASPSETLAWWSRAAQARRVAGMLSPRDAQLAETFAVECEDQAREASVDCIRSVRSTSLPYTRFGEERATGSKIGSTSLRAQ